MPSNQQTKSVPCTPTTSASSFSPRSSVSSTATKSNPAISVCRSIAHHAGSMVKQIVKVPSSNSRSKKPDMSKMRTVTPVYDHDLKRWVWPVPVTVHRDEPAGVPCKQLPHPAKQSQQTSG